MARTRLSQALQVVWCFVLLALCWLPATTFAQFKEPGKIAVRENNVPATLKDIGIEQRLDQQLPLDLKFVDEYGKAVQLKDYFGQKPVVLAIVYYTCPMLCNQVLNGAAGALKSLSFNIGDEFDVVTVSFDPKDTPETAFAKKQAYLDHYDRKGPARKLADQGWHFLTGDEASIKALCEAAGFKYRWDEATSQYIHASGIMVVTPQGRMSRYLYGIEYAPKDLKYSLIEASQNKIGSPVDQLYLFCFHYDPVTGKYGPVIMNFIRLGGLVTFLGLALLVFVMRRRRVAREKVAEPKPTMNPTHFACLPLLFNWIPFAPEQGSTIAESVDYLYLFLVGLTIFFGVAISAAVFYFAVKYRRRSEDEYPAQIEGSMKLEVLWIVVPFIIVMVIFWWSASVYFKIFRPPSDPLDIYVVGKQWMWKFEHPDGQREINELHVPIGRRIKLTMGSEDVIHSLFVPAFRVKADVVPGRITSVWWEPTKPGRYELFCAEYCGTKHSGMIGWIVVQEPADYQAWLSGSSSGGSLASNGEKLFQTLACNSCHKSDQSGRGPALEGIFGKQQALQGGQTVLADENYIRESILNPRAKVVAGYDPVMPTFQGLVSEEQLLQLIAYVKSLGQKSEGGAPKTILPPANTTQNSPAVNRQKATPPAPAKQETRKQ
ncbi:MAG: cytochrome c oxidase subunit II [Acidobacteria bacterium]|nr:cytochrome c oxidase subunit II [Acidobacteriota bacterium]